MDREQANEGRRERRERVYTRLSKGVMLTSVGHVNVCPKKVSGEEFRCLESVSTPVSYGG